MIPKISKLKKTSLLLILFLSVSVFSYQEKGILGLNREITADSSRGEEYFILPQKFEVVSKPLDSPEIAVNNANSLAYYQPLDQKQLKELEVKLKPRVVRGRGFKYTVQRGDTIEKIAKKFGVSKKDLISANNLLNENKLKAGETIYIPLGNRKSVAVISQPRFISKFFVKALTNIGGMLVPVNGLNQGITHSNNGVDISSDCGTPVYSADSGIVIESYDGWNGGYGNYIKIRHQNYSTLYGHLSKRYVAIGDYVEAGSLIGLVGATGKVSGPTGCHLHFEVLGRENPLVK